MTIKVALWVVVRCSLFKTESCFGCETALSVDVQEIVMRKGRSKREYIVGWGSEVKRDLFYNQTDYLFWYVDY